MVNTALLTTFIRPALFNKSLSSQSYSPTQFVFRLVEFLQFRHPLVENDLQVPYINPVVNVLFHLLKFEEMGT